MEQNKLSTRILDEERFFEMQQNQILFEKQKHELIDDLDLYLEGYKREEYERKWQEIKKKYKSVRLFSVRANAIGETIGRYICIIKTEKNEPDVLKVFLPEMKTLNRICNKELMELLGTHIYWPRYDEIIFWAYVYRNHFTELDLSQLKKYASRKDYPVYEVEPYKQDFVFPKDKIDFAEQKLKEMHLKKDFACFAARTAAYNLMTMGKEHDYEYRNMDFNSYAEAIKYLGDKNIQTIKMGREANAMTPINNCIDYAYEYADEFLDLYIFSKCKFLVTNSTGVFALAFMFGIPLLMVNVVPMSFGMGGSGYTKYDLYIPKKYYDVNKKRFLSLKEMTMADMYHIDGVSLVSGKRYAMLGIQIINNTPEEITEATAEFFERLNGTWRDTQIDIQYYERYKQVYGEIKSFVTANKEQWIGEGIPYRPAATYLRRHPYLLA